MHDVGFPRKHRVGMKGSKPRTFDTHDLFLPLTSKKARAAGRFWLNSSAT